MLDSLVTKEVTEADELECYFIEALYWSIGAGLLEDGRIKFDGQVKNLASLQSVKDEDKVYAGMGKTLLYLYSTSWWYIGITLSIHPFKFGCNYLSSQMIGLISNFEWLHIDGALVGCDFGCFLISTSCTSGSMSSSTTHTTFL